MIALLLPLLLLLVQDARDPEVLEWVAQGDVSALEQRFGAQPSATALQLLAQAAANHAEKQEGVRRDAAFRQADQRYQRWVTAVGNDRSGSEEQRQVRLAEAELQHGRMRLTRWAVPELDRFALAPPGRGDFKDLRTLLEGAFASTEAAEGRLLPLIEQLNAGDARLEEQFLALGIFQRVRVLRRETQLQQAWLRLYLAQVPGADPKQRAANLKMAERLFRTVGELLGAGPVRVRARVGLARTFRAQQRYAEAVAVLRDAMPDTKGFRSVAEVRYEWGRTHVSAAQFAEARSVLQPLVQRDLARLKEDEQGGRFYISLAQLWYAYSFLEESLHLRRAAGSNPGGDNLLRKADRARSEALARMNQLAGRGGPWERLVTDYLGPHLDLDAAPSDLGLAELLFVARRQSRAGKWQQASALLSEALQRRNVQPDLLPDLRFELAVALSLTGKRPEAARRFQEFIEQHVAHPLAGDAITRCYELQAEIADASRQPDDYRAVARTLATLLARFPEHPQRLPATWWAPRALEAAGDFEAAARGYAGVPPQSPFWQEAARRRNACLLTAWQNADAPPEQAPRLARTLIRYATDPSRTAPELQPHVRKALLDAAELYRVAQQPEKVLETLDHPRLAQPTAEEAQRASGLRLGALTARGRFEQAARLATDLLAGSDGVQRVLPLLQAALQELNQRQTQPDLPETRAFASALLPVFAQAEQRLRQAGEAAVLQPVLFGLARLQYLGGQFEAAETTIDTLVLQGGDTNTRWWQARIRTARVDAGQGGPERALQAWGALLPALRASAPSLYWEGRYHALRLLRQSGQIEQVRAAIEQEKIWVPDLGGPPWAQKIEELAR